MSFSLNENILSKLGVEANACNPSAQEIGTEGSRTQSQPRLAA